MTGHTDVVPERYAAYGLKTSQDARLAAAFESGLKRAGWTGAEIDKAFCWYRDNINPKADAETKAISFAYCMERAGLTEDKVRAAFQLHQYINEHPETVAPAGDNNALAGIGSAPAATAITHATQPAGLLTGPGE